MWKVNKYFYKCTNEECSKCKYFDQLDGCLDSKFKLSQYEGYNGGLFFYNEHVNARYIQQEEVSYKDNPLIESLPPPNTIELIVNKLQCLPLYSKSESEKEDDYRIYAILRLKKFFYIFSKHIEIDKKLSMTIRAGYEARNFLTPDFIKKANFTSNLLNDKWLKDKLSKLNSITNFSICPMDGFSLIGISGEGKTNAINKLLTTYPQVIVHTEYGGSNFLFYQLVWIKLDCTHRASVKGLCIEFFVEVDRVLGTEYFRKHGKTRNSVYNMMVAMAHIAGIHQLGTLIIDEIQHLASSKTGIEDVLNFLVTLKNKMNVPLIYIGTLKVMDSVLGKSYTQARRASGIGEIIWLPMPKGQEWDDFISVMWKYQWTKEFTPLTEEISNAFYSRTLGITDRAVKLFMAIQVEAILCNEEKITKTLIEKVSDKNMPLTGRIITAIRNRNIKVLASIDDYCTFDIEKYIEERRAEKEYQIQLKKEKENMKNQVKLKRDEIENELILLMIQKGIEDNIAKVVAKSVLNKYGIDKDIALLKEEAGRLILEIKKNNKLNSNGTQSKENINKSSKNKAELGYEAFKEGGLIKGDSEA